MDATQIWLLALLVFAAALLYSTVGHAGASGYIAAMSLLGVAPVVMRPTALVLNIAVAAIATLKFARAGYFSWALFWPFAITSIPAAFIGGRLGLPDRAYKIAVGLVLLYAAGWLFYGARRADRTDTHRPPVWLSLLVGALLGLLSGLTGVGGGIFLSPLLLLMRWAGTKQASAVAAPFILVNSISGLLGAWSSLESAHAGLAIWLPAVIIGGWLGAEYGSRRLAIPLLRQCLAVVLVVAGLKLALT